MSEIGSDASEKLAFRVKIVKCSPHSVFSIHYSLAISPSESTAYIPANGLTSDQVARRRVLSQIS